jgi:hypothetical protein
MDVWLIETWHVLDGSCKTRVVLLSEHIVHQRRVGERIHNPGVKVAPEAVPFWVVEHEASRRKRTSLHTATTCTASDVEWILFGVRYDIVAVAAKPRVGVKDGSLEDLSGIVVVRLRILRPIPISERKLVTRVFSKVEFVANLRLTSCVTTVIPQGFLIGCYKVAMPQDEVTDPVNVRRLAAMDRFVIIEAVRRIGDTRYAVLLRQTQHCVNV